jgi:futalosine hydrolase
MNLNKPILIVVATALEAAKLPKLERAITVVAGIGQVNAALATQAGILEHQPSMVLSVGIGGAYPSSGLQPGDAAVSTAIYYAGLGAMDGNQFLDLERLGFPLLEQDGGKIYNFIPVASKCIPFAEAAAIASGPFLTLETVTGSLESASRLERQVPGALVEGMEGAGVAHVAFKHKIPCLEVRGISNMVGPRDRSQWKIGDAMRALGQALKHGWPVLLDSEILA